MLVEQIISLIAPHYCLSCDLTGFILCDNCSIKVPTVPPRCYSCQTLTAGFDTCQRCDQTLQRVIPATTYNNDLAKKLVHKLKFERASAAAKVMAQMIAKNITAEDWLIVPVPTANSRVRRRGYDQAQLIARHLSHLKLGDSHNVLLRLGQKRQVGENRKQRQAQIAGQLITLPRSASKVYGRNILLVDDVMTTGSTLESAAKALKPLRPAKVCAAVFAAA